eukprot:CAMPEP_0202337384 /NCGR_PEP_ID=MMETSP1126-20121109/86_1 /ASSEMBLY_ACC=CAM_ASM_000457 /TAXON_ID=3047 /ORGANISM="Dunaliella tertiolecta, Strain CCMP1320" /LENGTH=49 /DNA_ID=CAMNT_0048927561 /DNA_START=701 /DNA_END=850 /DNA_ORIENTATION=-
MREEGAGDMAAGAVAMGGAEKPFRGAAAVGAGAPGSAYMGGAWAAEEAG